MWWNGTCHNTGPIFHKIQKFDKDDKYEADRYRMERRTKG